MSTKKIEPVAYMTYKGYLLHAADPKVAEHDSPAPIYTREALEAAVNAAVEECELVTGARFTIDTAAIINQLTGE